MMQKKATEKPKKWVIGIDEVGRGPLAGPVYVCGVACLSKDYKKAQWIGLTDSKKLSPKVREKWEVRAQELEQKGILRIAIASRTAKQIDAKGISICIKECIIEILEKLAIDHKEVQVLLDGGLRAPEHYSDQKTIIKGDLKEKIISLASVVAKVTRDRYMITMAKKYPIYGWDQNKGYGTKAHILRLKKHDLTPLHRKSFLRNILDI